MPVKRRTTFLEDIHDLNIQGDDIFFRLIEEVEKELVEPSGKLLAL